MSLPVTILHEAEIELWEAARYYESKSPGLGADFVGEMEESIRAIQEAPLRQRLQDDESRRFLTKRFPYQVVYHIHNERIWIVAFSNQRREPGYWSGRV